MNWKALFKKRTRSEWIDLTGNIFIKYRHFSNRGNSLTSEFKGIIEIITAGGVIILLIEKWTGYLLPFWCILVVWAGQKSLEIALAWLDRKYLHFWQREAAWIQKNINPIEQEKMKRLREINKKINEINARTIIRGSSGNDKSAE